MLCLSFADLTGGSDPVIKPTTLWVNIHRGKIVSAHRGGGEGSEALYVWSSIPEKYRKKYIAIHGDPEEAMRKAREEAPVKEDSAARAYYESYRYTDKRGEEKSLTEGQIDDYTRNASVLNALAKTAQETKSLRSSLNASKVSAAWDIVAETSENMRERYGHSLPGNITRLRAKMKDYAERGYEVLISGKLGNTSAMKITKEFGEMIIALKRSRVPVYTDRALLEKANEIAEERGWKPLRSLSGLKRWLNSPAVQPLWYDAAYGEQTARQRFARKHRTALPSRRDSLWYGDGTKLNLYYRDEKGNVRTTCVYEVVDAMSEVLLGYHISDSEDYEPPQALRDSARQPGRSQEAGEAHRRLFPQDMHDAPSDPDVQRRVEDDREYIRKVPESGSVEVVAVHRSERDCKKAVEPSERGVPGREQGHALHPG